MGKGSSPLKHPIIICFVALKLSLCSVEALIYGQYSSAREYLFF